MNHEVIEEVNSALIIHIYIYTVPSAIYSSTVNNHRNYVKTTLLFNLSFHISGSVKPAMNLSINQIDVMQIQLHSNHAAIIDFLSYCSCAAVNWEIQ